MASPEPITLIGAEEHLPYDRPPLSKKLLAGDWEPDRITLRKRDDVDALGLDLRLGVPATGLDADGRAVDLADGSVVPFDAVVLATGSTPRRLPGQEAMPSVHELRTLDDSMRLRGEIADGTARVVVIGAGFIGLEVAATARARGCTVTVLEGLAAPLIRGLGAEMGNAVAAVHEDEGTQIRLGVTVAGLDHGGVRLADGEVVPADVIVVGIGVAPATAWLDGSGLEIRDGVVCDATLAAGPPGVYAAGDIARWPNDLFDEEMRVEHWTNAAEQGAVAARNLLAAAQGSGRRAVRPGPVRVDGPGAPSGPVPRPTGGRRGRRHGAGGRRRSRRAQVPGAVRPPWEAARGARAQPPAPGDAVPGAAAEPAPPGTTRSHRPPNSKAESSSLNIVSSVAIESVACTHE